MHAIFSLALLDLSIRFAIVCSCTNLKTYSMWIPEKKAAEVTWCIHVGLLFLAVYMWIVIGHVIMVPR